MISDKRLQEFIDWSRMPPEAADALRELKELRARAEVQAVQELEPYYAGCFSDYGGGDVHWWFDYIRAELSRAYEFYQSQIAGTPAQPVSVPEGWQATPIEPTPEMCEAFAASVKEAGWPLAVFELVEDAPKVFKAMLAAAPRPPC